MTGSGRGGSAMTAWKRSAACVACLLVLLAPQGDSASPPLEPESAWKAALDRIGAKDYQGAVLLLDNLRRSETFSKSDEAGFLLGVSLHKQQRWQEAAEALEATAPRLPVLADYALYYAASAYRALGMKPQALAALSRLLQEQPGSLVAERAQRERAALFADADQLVQAEEAYRDYLSRAADATRRREAMLSLAEITLKEGKRQEGEDLLRQLWLKWPGSREAARAGELLSGMPEPRPFTIEEQFDRALTLHRDGQHAQAVTAFAPFLIAGPPYALRARLLSGISRFYLRDYDAAIALLSPLIADRTPVRAEALYWSGRSYGRLGNREKAIKTWVRLVNAYPKSSWAADSLYLMALNYVEDGRSKPATQALSRLLRDHPSSKFAEAALWSRAWIHYRQSSLGQALHDLRRLQTKAATTSRVRAQALYWQGRVLERQRERGGARDAYRGLLAQFGDEYYYAEQARLRLSRLDPTAVRVQNAAFVKPGDSGPPDAYPASNGSQAAKARLLKELNLREEAAEEFWSLIGRSVDDRGLLYEACSAFLDLGYIDRSVWVAKRLLRPLYARTRPAEPVPRYWEFLYPLGYWDLVKEQSARYALDPYMVMALIREESSFGERVVSPAGAVGLMQLLPKTADQLIRAAGGSGEPSNLDAPAANIELGTRYLAKMLEEFKGNWTLALAAYNAGPHQVRRWLELWGYRTDVEFTEEIPFSETQQYVKRVMGSYYRYRAQYAGSEQGAGSDAG